MIEDTSSCFNEENTKPEVRTVTPNHKGMIHKLHKLSKGVDDKISQLVGFLFPQLGIRVMSHAQIMFNGDSVS